MAIMTRAPILFAICLFSFAAISCVGGVGPGGAGLTTVEADGTLTHAVLILENPSPRPLAVTLRRTGFTREFTVPPRSALRQLVPEGPLLVLWGAGRREVVLRARTRGTLRLAVDATTLQ